MSQLFGYSLERAKKGQNNGPSFVRKESDDAATPVAGGPFTQSVIGQWMMLSMKQSRVKEMIVP